MGHPLPSVDLEACLFGGQAFTWWKADETIQGITRATRVTIDPGEGTWTSQPTQPPSFLERYLGAARCRPEALARDPDLGGLASRLDGLRLLDQDPWEGLLAFMISPVNNVPRIQETIARLCRALGPRAGGGFAMPGPQAIAQAGSAELRALGTGFRAPRIHAAAEAITSGELDLAELADSPIEEARTRLMAFDGVGPKVAECILCYALNFDDAFPVDRWVARAADTLLGEPITPEQARDRWGDRAAMAQQLLFHGARTGLIEGLAPSQVAHFDRWQALVDRT